MATADLERGAAHHRRRSTNAAASPENDFRQEEDFEGSLCLSDVEDDDHSTYSSYSQFYSTTAGSTDGGFSFTGGAVGWSSRRVSSASELSANEPVEIKVHSCKSEKICRICHLSLDEIDGADDNGAPIKLGCSCKDDLGAAHKNCAETWFKIKGNKVCEICNCTARNVVGASESADSTQHSNENASSSTEPPMALPSSEPQRFWQGHRFLNFLLACMVFAFVISWLFHFKVPS